MATVLKSLVCLQFCLGVTLDERPHSLVGSVHLARPSSFDETPIHSTVKGSDVVLPANAQIFGEAAKLMSPSRTTIATAPAAWGLFYVNLS